MDIIEEALKGHEPVKAPAIGRLNSWLDENGVPRSSKLRDRILGSEPVRKACAEDIVAQMRADIEHVRTKEFCTDEFMEQFTEAMLGETVPGLCKACGIRDPDIEWFRERILGR